MKFKQSSEFPLYILMVNMFIAMTGIGVIIPIMPTVIQEFGVGGKAFGLLIATFAFAQFLFSPLAGDLSDRLGRKKTIVFGLVLFSFSQLLFGLTNQLWLLYVSRVLGGMGGAFMIPSMMAYVADITTMENRAKGMGRLGASMSLGFVIGPGIGGFLSEFGLRAPFFIAAAVAALSAVVSVAFLPETRQAAHFSADAKKRDSLWKQLILSVKTPYFALLIMMFTLSFGLANFQSTISLFADIKFGFEPMDISVLMVTAGMIGVIVQAFVLDRTLRRFGEIPVMNVSLVAAGFAMLSLLLAQGFWSVMVISSVFFIAASLLRPAINTMVSKMAGDEQGFAAGMNNAYMSIGNVIGPALAGTLFDINMGLPYVFGALIIAACLLISLKWAKTRKAAGGSQSRIGYSERVR
ncbi:MFS transporter [Bacillus xiapuensis]|uniref:MFS transporter n=1 Tax=Bacillus xiapuensis TaxID=2014075 RepID=UPI000C2339B2|nr:MFS transporter [Bacillus xiapuensis]